MARISLNEQVYRVGSNGRLYRIRDKNYQSEDPEYIRAMTIEHNKLFKKLFDNRDNGKLILKELSTKLKEEGVRYNYHKIKGCISIYWEGRRQDIYCTKSGYLRMEKYDQDHNVVKYYFMVEDIVSLAEKIWKLRLMNRKFYQVLVK